MTLVVLGDGIERTLPVAALAAVTSGETVLFTSDEDLGELTLQVEGVELAGTAVIQSVAPDAATEGDGYIIASADVDRLLSETPARFAGKPVLLGPGGFAGALVSGERFRRAGTTVPLFSEVPGWIASGKAQDGHIRLGRKLNLDFAAPSNEETSRALEYFGRYLPDIVPSDLITTSMSNINAIIHPPVAVLNATRMENGEDWRYWDEGFTPAVQRVMDAIDAERLQVIEALGGKGQSLIEFALASYGADGMTGSSYYEAIKSRPNALKRPGPATIESRFLTADVPFGVAAFEQLAERVGVEHTALTALRVMSELVIGRELKADSFGVDALVEYARGRQSAMSR